MTPTYNRYLVRVQAPEEKRGGLYLVNEQGVTYRGTITAIGPRRRKYDEEGDLMRLSVGDKVIFHRASGVPVIQENGETLTLLREDELLAFEEGQ